MFLNKINYHDDDDYNYWSLNENQLFGKMIEKREKINLQKLYFIMLLFFTLSMAALNHGVY